MIELKIRPIYQKYCVQPVVLLLDRHTNFTPMWVTGLALLFGVIAAVLLYLGYPVSASLLLLLSGYCDTLDGTLARWQKRSSAKGAVLDIVSDRVVEFAIIIALFSVAPHVRAWVALWMMGASFICIASFLVVAIFIENKAEKSFHYSVGFMGRLETFIFFIVMILLPNLFLLLGWLYVVLVLATAVVRIYQFMCHYEERSCLD